MQEAPPSTGRRNESTQRGLEVGTFEEPLVLASDVVFADNDGVSSILHKT